MQTFEALNDKSARKRILDALDIEAHLTATMPNELRARIVANLPSPDEIAGGRWK